MIYIVSGFFRSGTSMMMQALHHGGIPVYRNLKRDRLNEHYTDRMNRPNPVSLYEPSFDDLKVPGFPRWHNGHLVKLLVPFLSAMAVHEYRVVVMRRDPEAIMESYAKAFKEHWDRAMLDLWIDEYPQRMEEAQKWFENRRDVYSVHIVDLDEVVKDPVGTFSLLKSAGWPLDPIKAAQVPQTPEFERGRLCLAA